MKISSLVLPALSGLLLLGSVGGTAMPAKADTASTLMIAGAAASIVGALLYDSNNRPYYINNHRRYYVTQQEAGYYRSHHQGYMRQAYVPEREYPVARDPYHNHHQ